MFEPSSPVLAKIRETRYLLANNKNRCNVVNAAEANIDLPSTVFCPPSVSRLRADEN